MPTRSTTPRKSLSAPIGICRTSGVELRRSTIMSTQRKKSAPVRSSLLTKHIRGHGVLVRLAPHGHRLRLDAGDTVEHRDGAVEDAQRALHLGGEVDVAGGVDDVDLVVLPPAGRRGGRDRDAALLLLLHPVHDGGALVDLADLVGDAGVEEDPLGRGGLAGVDVRHDADVADLGQVGGDVDGHLSVIPSGLGGGAAVARWSRQVRTCGGRPGRGGRPRVVPAGVTSGSGRRPCWTRPSCGCPRGA